jgi:hypothetical protein
MPKFRITAFESTTYQVDVEAPNLEAAEKFYSLVDTETLEPYGGGGGWGLDSIEKIDDTDQPDFFVDEDGEIIGEG